MFYILIKEVVTEVYKYVKIYQNIALKICLFISLYASYTYI